MNHHGLLLLQNGKVEKKANIAVLYTNPQNYTKNTEEIKQDG